MTLRGRGEEIILHKRMDINSTEIIESLENLEHQEAKLNGQGVILIPHQIICFET